MKILGAELVTSAASAGVARAGLIRDDIPQFAFLGRSNVGKSSLLNALMRQKLARTSAAAGKTRQANFYRVTIDTGPGAVGRTTVFLVDLPGYGYARGGGDAAAELAATVQTYVRTSLDPARGGLFLLVDARHPEIASDGEAHRWLSEAAGPPHIVATKIDKLTRAERARSLQVLERRFGAPALPVSATNGEGVDAIWRTIAASGTRSSA